MSAREAADRLFNRAMTAAETGDSVAAARLIPMALTAYRGLDSLDLDARYHIALLTLAIGEPERARDQADSILARVPDHLLGLQAAAAAERRLGRPGRARQLDRRLLDGYTPEAVESRPEYRMHEAVITRAVQEARDRLSSPRF